MRTGIFLSYADGGYSNFAEAADEVIELEKIGVDIALVAENWEPAWCPSISAPRRCWR